MIKVTRFYDNPKSPFKDESYHKTFTHLIKEIFPDIVKDEYNGVKFRYLLSDGVWHHNLIGISILAGSYPETRRRVMITKDDMIDDDKIREKYEELKVIAERDRISREKAQNEYKLASDARDKLTTELGLERFNSHISSNTETSVKISGEVNGAQLSAISLILNEDLTTQLNGLVVPIDKAKEIYRIMYPTQGEKNITEGK